MPIQVTYPESGKSLTRKKQLARKNHLPGKKQPARKNHSPGKTGKLPFRRSRSETPKNATKVLEIATIELDRGTPKASRDHYYKPRSRDPLERRHHGTRPKASESPVRVYKVDSRSMGPPSLSSPQRNQIVFSRACFSLNKPYAPYRLIAFNHGTWNMEHGRI